MTSQRKRKKAHVCRSLLRCRQQSQRFCKEWDSMPPVGREFGSPDFERLMDEDHRQRRGVFDPHRKETEPSRSV